LVKGIMNADEEQFKTRNLPAIEDALEKNNLPV
jgi:hypothetical protein